MKPLILLAIVFAFLVSSSPPLVAQPLCLSEAEGKAAPKDPKGRPIPKPPREIQAEIALLLLEAQVKEREGRPELALGYCIIAELMKRVGDPQAEEFYQKAINTDPANPEYHWLFGDYLRFVRGPRQPLFPQAEEQYYKALEKILQSKRKCQKQEEQDKELICYIHRSLVALYERDGLPLNPFYRIDEGRPFVFLSTQNNYARLLTDVGEVDEVREFTSEALFASSRERLNRPLSRDELRGVLREKEQVETLNRLRVRYSYAPVVDAFVQYRDIQDAQITNFFEPTHLNDVQLTLYGVGVETPFNVYPFFDGLLRAEVRKARREGLIEFLPEATEDVLSVIGKAVFSRFVGPDKVNLEMTIVSDDIDQNVANPIERRLLIVAPTIRYERFRGTPFGLTLAPRPSELFAGAAWREETFGEIDVQQQDFFVGLSIKQRPGLWQKPRPKSGWENQSFDLTIQPTLFTAEREGTDAQGQAVEPLEHWQYRTFVTLLYRLYDDENFPWKIPPLAFLNLVLLGSHDLGVKGPKDFESFKVGAELDAKFIIKALQGGTTLLASARYEFQRFHRLDQEEHLFLVNIKMGF